MKESVSSSQNTLKEEKNIVSDVCMQVMLVANSRDPEVEHDLYSQPLRSHKLMKMMHALNQ